MSLQQLIERYISYRQALGERFQTNATVRRAFGRAIGPWVHRFLLEHHLGERNLALSCLHDNASALGLPP